MKKKDIIAYGIIFTIVAVGAVFLFQGEFVTTVEATVNEIVEHPASFDSQFVITEGIVTEWEIKEFIVTIDGPDIDETFVIHRYYLTIEDPITTDIIKVRMNYRNKTLDLDENTFTIGETISVEGIVKEFKFETLEEDIDIDLVILAKEITLENGDVIEILTDEEIQEFRERRQRHQELRQSGNIEDYIEEITAEVLTWEINEYNITIVGPDDFYVSKIVTRPLLLVRNTDTNEIILVKVSHPRINSTLEEDFIFVGEIITLKGLIRDGELNTELFSSLEFDKVMLGMSLINSDDEEVTLISPEDFMNARPPRRFRIGGRFGRPRRLP